MAGFVGQLIQRDYIIAGVLGAIAALLAYLWFCLGVVAENHEWVVEKSGVYDNTLKSGPVFILRIFQSVRERVFVGETPLRLYAQGQQLELEDTQVGLTGEAVVKIVDSRVAVYSVNPVAMINGQPVRSRSTTVIARLAVDTIQGAIQASGLVKGKKLRDVRHIQGTDITGDIITSVAPTLNQWGLELVRVVISDFQEPPAVQQARARQYEANLLLQVEQNRQQVITNTIWLRAKQLAGITEPDDTKLTVLQRTQIAAMLQRAAEAYLNLAWADAMKDLSVLAALPGFGPQNIQQVLGRMPGQGGQQQRGGP